MSLESLVVFILILGVLVTFHEFGHFIAAKLSGMKVEEFAFGFGPRLLTLFRRRETEYTIHAFPLGGFVKITGMEPGEEDIADGFQAQSLWKRALVIFAGPLFSFILGAVVLLFLGVYWGFQDFSQPQPIVGSVSPKSEAARIDLHAGDRVLELNGIKITNGIQMTQLVHSLPGQDVSILIDRDGTKLPAKQARPKWRFSYLGADWSFMESNQAKVAGVEKDSPAAKAGIEQDDELLAINGEPINGGSAMADAIKRAGNRRIDVALDRKGKTVVTSVTPDVQWVRLAGVKWMFPGADAVEEEGRKAEEGIRTNDVLVSINGQKIRSGEEMLKAIDAAKGKPLSLVLDRENAEGKITTRPISVSPTSVSSGSYTAVGLLGFTPAPKLVKTGFSQSIKQGFVIIGRMVQLLTETLTTKKIKTDIGGPVMIARVTESSVALGPYWVFIELGSLSLSLAIVNLIPIPAILDGGHLILLALEAIRKKRLSRSQMAAMQMVGIAFIGILFVIIFVSDIQKIIGGQVPQ